MRLDSDVAPRIGNEVSYVTRIKHRSLVAGAVLVTFRGRCNTW